MIGKVSLITPCYNGGAFIQNYIGNIVRQQYSNVQVIFVDDGSKEDIASMENQMKEAIEGKGYEFLFLKKENGGAASAVDLALKYVTGDYMMLLDMDDELFDVAISEKADYLNEHPETDIVVSNGYYVFEDNARKTCPMLKKEISADKILEGYLDTTLYNWPGTYMVRCDTFFEVNKGRDIYQSPCGQNIQIIFPAAYRGKIHYMNRYHMNYFVRKQSVSHTDDKKRLQYLLDGYENIRETVVEKVCESEEEREKYLRIIKVASIRKKLRYACRKKEKLELENQYKKLSSFKAVRLRDRVVYICGKNSALIWLYKAVNYILERVIKKVI